VFAKNYSDQGFPLKMKILNCWTWPKDGNCLASRWELALSVFSKDPVMCYHIGSRTQVLQPSNLLAQHQWRSP